MSGISKLVNTTIFIWVPVLYLLSYFSLVEGLDYAESFWGDLFNFSYLRQFLSLFAAIPSIYAAYNIINRSNSIERAIEILRNDDDSLLGERLKLSDANTKFRLTVKQFKSLDLEDAYLYINHLKANKEHEDHFNLFKIYDKKAQQSSNIHKARAKLVESKLHLKNLEYNQASQIKVRMQAWELVADYPHTEDFFKIGESMYTAYSDYNLYQALHIIDIIHDSPELTEFPYFRNIIVLDKAKVEFMMGKKVEIDKIKQKIISDKSLTRLARISLWEQYHRFKLQLFLREKELTKINQLYAQYSFFREATELVPGGGLTTRVHATIERVNRNYSKSKRLITNLMQYSEERGLWGQLCKCYIHLSLIELLDSNFNHAYDYCEKGIDLNSEYTRSIPDTLVLLQLKRDILMARMDNLNVDAVKKRIGELTKETGIAEYDYAYEYI